MAEAVLYTGNVIADNAGKSFTEEEFESAESCPQCGGELIYGSSINVRMNNTSEMSMVTDIDSGQKVTGDFRGKTCVLCHYIIAMVDIYGYEGY